MTHDMSPYINGQRVSDEVAKVARDLAKIRRSKLEYDRAQREKRDPKLKKRKANEH